MDSGKRVRLDVGGVSSLKKQKLAGSAGSDNEESLNGVDCDESLKVSSLLWTASTYEVAEGDARSQLFQKAAIWREMSEYKRKFSRAQITVDALELERNQCDARLSAVDLCWNQVSPSLSLHF